jgi:hypothetical protein
MHSTHQGWQILFLLHWFNWDSVCQKTFVLKPWIFHVFFLSQYQFAKFKNDGYSKSGKGYLKLQLINQREDFSFALFSGGLLKVNFSIVSENLSALQQLHCYSEETFILLPIWSQPKLIAVSNKVAFTNPKAPVYPRLAQGKSWNEVSLSTNLQLGLTSMCYFSNYVEHLFDKEPTLQKKIYTHARLIFC